MPIKCQVNIYHQAPQTNYVEVETMQWRIIIEPKYWKYMVAMEVILEAWQE